MFLDAINVSAVGLMAAVMLRLGHNTLDRWESWLIVVVVGILAFRFKLSSVWLVFVGAVLGWVLLDIP
jgi:chromate transporter